jgi:hypothetical protein
MDWYSRSEIMPKCTPTSAKKKKPGNALIHFYPQNMFQQEDLRKKSSCLQQFTVNTTFSPPTFAMALEINSLLSQFISTRLEAFAAA